MKKTILAAAVASAFTGAAFADDAAAPAAPYTLTANVGAVSDYLFRGISQSGGNPAIQGGVDFTHSSGIYLGTWMSSISWVGDTQHGTYPTEIDLYGGYRGTFADDYSYDVGLITYNYLGHGRDTTNTVSPWTAEAYGQLGWKFLSVKYSHTISPNFVGWGTTSTGSPAANVSSRNSHYLETNLAYDLGNGWGVSAHLGHQWVKGFDSGDASGINASYTDWNIGGTKDVGFGVVGLKYSDTNAQGQCITGSTPQAYCWGLANGSNSGYNAAKGTVIASFTKTF
jgi:uncharacterized protein (TIGR02001 family)